MPVANTAATATNPTFEKCYLNGGTCSLDGQIESIQWLKPDGTTAAKPTWITWPVSSEADANQ